MKINGINVSGKMIGGVIAALFGVIFLMSSWFSTKMGYVYVVQNTLTGTVTVYSDVGTHFKMPMFTTVTPWKKAMTITSSSSASDQKVDVSRLIGATEVTFADTYNATIPYTIRFRLPGDATSMIKINEEFRTQDNLVDALLTKNAKNVTVVTATQYTGEEFFQGGLNKFKVQMEDQLVNGLYQTERRQVEIKQTDIAPVSSENDDANRLETRSQMVWKNVVLTDEKGRVLRSENPLSEYNITVSQLTVDRPTPENRLQKLLEDKKSLVAKRITTIQAQETAKAEAKTAQLEKEIQKTKEIQDAQRIKELAVIDKQKQVEMEKEQAKLETVRKQKELDIAQAERDIQKANAEASKFQAIAIKQKGLAEAEVERAKFRAKQEASDVYLADIELQMAKVIYPALKGITVQMPAYYNGGSGDNAAGGVLNSIDVLSNISAMKEFTKSQK